MKKLTLLFVSFFLLSCSDDTVGYYEHQNVGAYVLTKYEAKTPIYILNNQEAETDLLAVWNLPDLALWNTDWEALNFIWSTSNKTDISLNLPVYKERPGQAFFSHGILRVGILLEEKYSNEIVHLDISQSYNYTDLSDEDFLMYEDLEPVPLEINIIDEEHIHATFLLRLFDHQKDDFVVTEVDAEFLKVRGRYRD
ncbi:hypothetical protein [Psychroflexus planctonicus]|uniref:Uncharacterized protein n=1 Tax=Psychroflexus planctonicus TaxID=1526575 RepID=A0ABQ1SFK7_9FLAO|nr:hypothetical protein [Psychroflexus planctonicus]GGE35928.1 hypothetical protein GCM10010832_15160 [Psychroflexus planctonicus]